jgi:hypothetical protein
VNQNHQQRIMEQLVGEWASIYQKEHKKTPQIAPSLVRNPQKGLEYFLQDSFARAGGEQAGYGKIAVEVLRQCVLTVKDYEAFVTNENAPELAWAEFEKICSSKDVGLNKKLNEGVVKGLIRLAQESRDYDYNPFRYIGKKVEFSMTDAFIALTNIKGIADKIASFLLRDMVCILNLEEKVPLEHGIFLQPIDRWVKKTAICLWADLEVRVPSWGIAMRIVDKCNEFNISGIRFNQGAWKFGTSKVKDMKHLCNELEELL